MCATTTTRMFLIAAAMGAVLAAATPVALAQSSSGGAPVRVKRPVRKPVINLEEAARQPRPGQVVPEGAPAAAEPAPATPAEAPASPKPADPADPADPATPTATNPRPAEAAPATMSMMSTPAPHPARAATAGEAVSITVRRIDGAPSQIEWRALGADGEGRWETVPAEGTLTGRIEIRTAMGGGALVEIDGRTTLRIGRLSRLRIERVAGGPGGGDGTGGGMGGAGYGGDGGGRGELVVTLERGKVGVEPRAVDELGLAVVPVRVVTPGASLVRRVPVEVTHDAFNGTRETMLTRE